MAKLDPKSNNHKADGHGAKHGHHQDHSHDHTHGRGAEVLEQVFVMRPMALGGSAKVVDPREEERRLQHIEGVGGLEEFGLKGKVKTTAGKGAKNQDRGRGNGADGGTVSDDTDAAQGLAAAALLGAGGIAKKRQNKRGGTATEEITEDAVAASETGAANDLRLVSVSEDIGARSAAIRNGSVETVYGFLVDDAFEGAAREVGPALHKMHQLVVNAQLQETGGGAVEFMDQEYPRRDIPKGVRPPSYDKFKKKAA